MLLARTLTYCGPDLVVLKKKVKVKTEEKRKGEEKSSLSADAAADAVVAAGGCIFKDFTIKYTFLFRS